MSVTHREGIRGDSKVSTAMTMRTDRESRAALASLATNDVGSE